MMKKYLVGLLMVGVVFLPNISQAAGWNDDGYENYGYQNAPAQQPYYPSQPTYNNNYPPQQPARYPNHSPQPAAYPTNTSQPYYNGNQECWTEYVTESVPVQGGAVQASNRSSIGAVIGGIAGAVLGAQVGQGNGRTAATGVGAVLGAVVGDRVDNRDPYMNNAPSGYTQQTRPVTRCRPR